MSRTRDQLYFIIGNHVLTYPCFHFLFEFEFELNLLIRINIRAQWSPRIRPIYDLF